MNAETTDANTKTICNHSQRSILDGNVMAERQPDKRSTTNQDRGENVLANPTENKPPLPKTRSTKKKRHIIYALEDPQTGLIMYVGYTSNIDLRLKQHLQSAKQTGTPKEQWLAELKQLNLQPKVIELEEIAIEDCNNAEIRWIEHFRQKGHKLTNGSKGGGIYQGKETTKVHTNLYLDAQLFQLIEKQASKNGQTPSWLMENILAVALGLREWPKPPKGIKKAKEIAR